MKYTKSIIGLTCLNIFLIFSMIFIANKTREIEKHNNNFLVDIENIKENIKINKIELTAHQNSSYLNNLYSLYFSDIKKNKTPNIFSLNQILDQENKITLVNIKK